MLKVIVTVCLFSISFSGAGMPIPASVERPEVPDNDRGATIVRGQLAKQIDGHVRRLSGFGYSGALLVATSDGIILRKAYGLADRTRAVPNTIDTVFDIASLSKQFTAAAVMKLEMEGKLSVGSPISEYLPKVPVDKSAITIHQLLTHTSGLPGGVGGPTEISRDQMVERILSRPLVSEPGTEFRYSNAGYTLLAAVVEFASGVPFRTYLKRAIFEPAGMLQTGFWGEEAPKVAAADIARGHDDLNKAGSPLEWSGTSWRWIGQGGVTSTIGDLYRWHVALNGTKILSGTAKEKMWTAHRGEYGYGWWVKKTERGTAEVSHAGDGDGFGAYFGWFKDEKVLVIGLSNVRHDLYPTHIKADEAIQQIVFGKPFVSPPDFLIGGDTKSAEKFTGTYKLETGGSLVIQNDDGQLRIGAVGQDAANILREGDDKETALRDELSSTTMNILRAYRAGDMEPLRKVGGEDLDFQKAIGDEINAIGMGKGELRSVEVLGTVPAGEPGVMNTFIQLNYEKGNGAYRFRWRGRYIDGTYTRSADLAAITPLQPTSANKFVAWNIMSWAPTKGLTLLIDDRIKPSRLTVQREGRQWTARRVL